MTSPREILEQRLREAVLRVYGPEYADQDPLVRPVRRRHGKKTVRSLPGNGNGPGDPGTVPQMRGEREEMTPEHEQKITHSYIVHYPAHPPRENDPHYRDFEEYRHRTQATAECSVGAARDDFSECTGELELHHSHLEFALANAVNLKWLEKDYPGVSDPSQVGAWIESAANLEWLCEFHHRGAGGVHTAAAADFEAEKYVRGLIRGEKEEKNPQTAA